MFFRIFIFETQLAKILTHQIWYCQIVHNFLICEIKNWFFFKWTWQMNSIFFDTIWTGIFDCFDKIKRKKRQFSIEKNCWRKNESKNFFDKYHACFWNWSFVELISFFQILFKNIWLIWYWILNSCGTIQVF